jgi:two-component system KDP operon response regulator KdpE
VIEDDPTVGQFVKRGLEEQRWSVDLVADGEEGETLARSQPYDLVVLDMRLPGRSGLDVLRNLRARGFERPVLVLTAQDAIDAKVETLRAGADDYVTKPFGMDELLARMRAASRRGTSEANEPRVRLGDLVIDLAAKRVIRDQVTGDIRLTPTEWHLLEVLLRHPGKLLSQRQLLNDVWGPGYADASGNLRLYMAQLRRKLEPDPARPRWLLTEPGMGYRFQPDAD